MRTHPARAVGHTTLAVLLAVLLAGLVAQSAAEAAPADPAGLHRPSRPVVTGVDGVPRQLAPQQRFVAKVEVANPAATRSPRRAITLRLSTDKAAERRDPVIGRARTSALPPGRRTRTRVRATLPASTRLGSYRLLACVADRCRPAPGTLRVAPGTGSPSPDPQALRGTLTGDLHLVDSGDVAEGPHRDRWAHSAHVSVQMAVSGRDTSSAVFASTGSAYRLAGTRTQQGPVGACARVVDERRDGEGRLAWDGDPYRDDIGADFARLDMSALSLRIELGYQRTVRETWTGEDDTCSVDTTTSSRALDVEELQLVQVGRTTTTVTYAVTGLQGPLSTPSDWDRVDGTLTLDLS
jgi:hypothetical protein